jgi:membrane-anchored protein YejM (alkaline phosphatase superfamily)
MAVLLDILFAVLLVPISAVILHAIAHKYQLSHVSWSNCFLIATVFEALILGLRYMIAVPVWREVLTLVISGTLGFFAIKHYFHDALNVAAEIFFSWFALRLLTSIVLGVIPGIVIAFS